MIVDKKDGSSRFTPHRAVVVAITTFPRVLLSLTRLGTLKMSGYTCTVYTVHVHRFRSESFKLNKYFLYSYKYKYFFVFYF